MAVHGLAREPARLDALGEAALAARAAGDLTRADGYQRLFDALGGTRPATPARSTTEISEVHEPVPSNRLPGKAPRPRREEVDRIALPLIGNDEPESIIEEQTPNVTLEDVAGMDGVKRRPNIAFLAPLKNPEMRKLYGKSLRGGLLLY